MLLEDNTYINVEMQKNDTGDIIRRSQYYLNRIITRSLKQGDSYFEIKRYVAINIINYNDPRFPKLHHVCGICDLETKNAVSDVEEIHIISLKSNIINDKRLLGWKEIFNEKDGWDMRKYKGKKLEKAVKELKRLSSDEEVMSLYDQEMKEKIDRSLLRDLSLKEGKNQGILEKEKEAALNFYKNGVSKDLICKSLNISLDKLNSILKEAK